MSAALDFESWMRKTDAEIRRLVRHNHPESSALGPWITPTLQNSWVNFDAGLAPTGYRMVEGGIQLRGAVKSGALAVPVFILPEWARPTDGGHIFIAACETGTARLDVSWTGEVIVSGYMSGGSNGLVSLSGVHYSVP